MQGVDHGVDMNNGKADSTSNSSHEVDDDDNSNEDDRDIEIIVKDSKDRLNHPPYAKDSSEEEWKADYEGQCFCGAVHFELRGKPMSASYCHCRDCQRLHGAPYIHHAIYKKFK